jgi:hypothetical protein
MEKTFNYLLFLLALLLKIKRLLMKSFGYQRLLGLHLLVAELLKRG